MAISRQNSLELGVAAGTAVDSTNSVAGGSAFTYYNGSPVTIATAAHGSGAVDCSGNGVAAALGWQSLSHMAFGYRYYIRRKSTPTATTQIFTGRNSSNYIVGNNITTANKLTLNKWAGGTIYTSTTTLAQDTWYRVEGICTINTSTTGVGQWKLFLGDSTTALEDSGSITNADFQSTALVEMRFGKHAATGLVEVIMDDMILLDAATFPGPYSGALALQRVRSIVSNPGVFTLIGTAPDMVTALNDSDDTTGVASPGSPSGAAITMDFGDITDNQGVRFTVRHNSPTDTNNISRVYTVKQGATTIATRTVNPLPTAATTFQITLTSGEVATLSGRSSLSLTAADTLV